MRERLRRQLPALILAAIALFAALGGTVYAAKRINGKSIRAKSLPGNRLKPNSVPGNRLKPRSIGADRLKPGVLQAAAVPTPLTGADINEHSLGQVPNATHAETADFAGSAGDAQTALNAVNAVNAQNVNGHTAGCAAGTQRFAGACWESSPSAAALTAPLAATECANRGGTLPEALALAAFAKQPGVNLHAGGEWSSDIVSVSGVNTFANATVASAGTISSGLYDGTPASETRHYRCVVPLLR